MTLPIVFRPKAGIDVGDVYRWYENERRNLGEAFLQAVKAALHRIADFPELFPRTNEGVRRALVERFPFAVFYLAEPDRIVVLAVLHTARDPRIWPSTRRK